jgi:hypothetical protein
MPRSFRELLDDYAADSSQWEVVKTEIVHSSNARNCGGTSIQELFRNKMTGEEMVRHTLRGPDGGLFASPHFRPSWK